MFGADPNSGVRELKNDGALDHPLELTIAAYFTLTSNSMGSTLFLKVLVKMVLGLNSKEASSVVTALQVTS